MLRYSSSATHTLKIAERIKQKRNEALLGGGQKRIDTQHKKVSNQMEFNFLPVVKYGLNKF